MCALCMLELPLMERKIKSSRTLVIVGIFSILMASLGLMYNLDSITADFSTVITELQAENDMQYFYTAFYTMTSICVFIYILLFISGIQLIRGYTLFSYVLLGIVIFEVVYYFILGQLWLHPDYGTSIAAATGVANGGLMIQVFTLFPLWAPILAIWSSKNSDN